MKKSVWITWETQPRNKSMADLLHAEFYKIEFKRNILIRYFLCCIHTFKILSKRYEVVITQNPSIVLCAFAAIFKPIFKYKFVIDAHNAGVFPKEGNSVLFMRVNDFVLKKADLVIVTNESLVDYLKEKDISSISITDPLPVYDENLFENERISKKVFVICSWSDDEPIALYLQVAEKLQEYKFYFSGNFNKYDFKNIEVPENVVLLGFVDEEEYLSLLFTSSVTIDLTLRDNCLVCGAYESISAEVPVILSDNAVNRSTFEEAAIYSSPDIDSLTEKVIESQLFDREKIGYFKDKYKERYESCILRFYHLIN